MNDIEKKRLLTTNTIYWIVAMLLPAMFDLGFKALATGPVKFPWVVVVPLLLIGPLLASNNLIVQAMTKSSSETEVQ